MACDSMTCKVTLAASRQMLNASQDKTQWAQKTVREYRLKGDPETVRRENGQEMPMIARFAVPKWLQMEQLEGLEAHWQQPS